MSSLSTVYGISIVLGSLAAIGAAYLGTKIYPVQSAIPPVDIVTAVKEAVTDATTPAPEPLSTEVDTPAPVSEPVETEVEEAPPVTEESAPPAVESSVPENIDQTVSEAS
jgi:hypothetical protein